MADDILKGVKINSKGFGIIPKLAMQDRSISPVAKAIYAYLNSYAGGGDTCFPGKKKMCYDLVISKDTLNKHLRSLIDNGYISVEQKKDKGKFSHNVYTILGEVLPKPKFSDTENTVTENTVDDNSVSEEVAPNIIKSNINKDNINRGNKINPINQVSTIDEIDRYKEFIKDNIGYETLLAPEYKNDEEVVDGIVELITEMVAVNKHTVRINGNAVSAEIVKSQFMKLNYSDVFYVLESLKKNTTKVINIRAYLLTALYNAKATMKSYYAAEVNHDFYGT
jgi:hypothetical protein